MSSKTRLKLMPILFHDRFHITFTYEVFLNFPFNEMFDSEIDY